MKRARSPKDKIPFETTGIPLLPPNAMIIVRVSPLDLIDGDARSVVAWNPNQCDPLVREQVRAILKKSSRPGNLSAAGQAAWEYFSGGPKKVTFWKDLDLDFQRRTRRELGFIQMVDDCIRLVCVDDDDESSSSSSSSSEERESERSQEEEESSSEGEAVRKSRKITDFFH